MAERKRSLLEKFISSLASASAGTDPKKGSGTQVFPAGTYKTNPPGAMPEMLGTGMAARAGRALSGRGRQIDQAPGLVGR